VHQTHHSCLPATLRTRLVEEHDRYALLACRFFSESVWCARNVKWHGLLPGGLDLCTSLTILLPATYCETRLQTLTSYALLIVPVCVLPKISYRISCQLVGVPQCGYTRFPPSLPTPATLRTLRLRRGNTTSTDCPVCVLPRFHADNGSWCNCAAMWNTDSPFLPTCDTARHGSWRA
jgi:hypothetical protein